MRIVIKGLSWIFILLVFLAALAWLFLSSSFLSGPRVSFVEGLINDRLGQDLQIDGDISVGLGRDLRITATGVSLPSPTMVDTTLAEIAELQVSLPASGLLDGEVTLKDIKLDGARAYLIIAEDGTTSWQPAKVGADTTRSGTTPFNGLADRILTPTNTSVLYQDARNGLDLDLKFDTLTVDRGPIAGNSFDLQGIGTLNGQAFDFSGAYTPNEPYAAELAFDDLTLSVDGQSDDTGTQAQLNFDVREFGQLLDVLKLNRDVEGSGEASAVFSTTSGVPRLDDVNLTLALDTGQSVEVTGRVGELGNPEDMSIATTIRLFPEGAEPATAVTRRDLKLISVFMEIDSTPGQIAQRKMIIETNGFTLDTEGEGPPPIKVSKLSRSEDGKLVIGSVNLRIGPPADPFLIFDGRIGDALRLHDVEAKGLLEIPSGALLSPELSAAGSLLGVFIGEFNLDGNINQLTLTNLDGRTQDTDLWNLQVHGTVKNVLKFEDLDLDIGVEVPSSSALMEAMQLKPVDAGPVSLGAQVKSAGTDWNANARVDVDQSELVLTLDLDDATTSPVLTGLIVSDLIRFDHLNQIIAAATQLRTLGGSNEAEEDAGDEPEQGALRNVTLQPIGSAVLLAGMDMDVDLDLRKIEGAKGFTTLQSELTLHENELNAGPLKFEYGGGQFDVSGYMDLSEGVKDLKLTGSAGGWKLAELLQQLNFKKGATGTLYSDFEVTGAVSSIQDFLGTMNGGATVSMSNGSIETQLLDLAGLGVLPWLFSPDKGKVAPIECMRAPITVANGKISTRQTTLETDLVQIVVFGDVDLNAKSMDLFVQPRKIGEPLSRSPWPFTAHGPLSKPDIKVKDGPRKLKRKDGASEMPTERRRCVPDILQLQ